MSFAPSSSVVPGGRLHSRVTAREAFIKSSPKPLVQDLCLRNGLLNQRSNTSPSASRTNGVVQTTSVEPNLGALLNLGPKSAERPEGPLGEVEEIDLEEFLSIAPGDKNGDLPKGEAIRIPVNSAIEPGVQLTSDLKIGKEMGGGVQGAVYELLGPDGKPANKLLKIMKYKEATAVTGMDISLQREWLIGQQINKLASRDGDIPGFMRTGAAVVEGEKDGLQFVGLIIDKLNGWALEKRFWKDEDFADIKYSLEMVTQVLRALDRAERKLGFLHNDMRIANIMEHRPESDTTYIPKGFYSKKAPIKVKLDGDSKARPLVFKIIDYGHARLIGPNKAQKLPEAPLMEKSYRTWFEGHGDVWRLLQDVSDSIDGRTWPMQDAAEVLLLLGLIKEVTGIKVHAFFAPKNAPAAQGLPWEKLGGFGHDIRRNSIRARAYLFAKGADYKPADALKWLEENRHERVKLSAHNEDEGADVGFQAKIE